MSAAKHTPAPWTVTDTGVRDVGGYIAFTPKAFHYPNQDERYEKEILEREANARLIAAAPELLEALKEIIYSCEIPFCDPSELVIKARAAIAIAEGKQA